jgi:hypothetical protein
MSKKMDEYLRRNLLVAKAEGARAAVREVLAQKLRLARREVKVCGWLRGALDRLDALPAELAKHRDEVGP